MHPIWYKAPPITVYLLYIYCIIGFPSVFSVPLQIIQLKLICVTQTTSETHLRMCSGHFE